MRKNLRDRNRARLNIEKLEDRTVPTTITNTISGYVYHDANANGLFDPGETPIANNTIQLFNSQGTLIGTTTTDATGFYKFTDDQTNLTTDNTLVKTVTFPTTDTNFNLNGVLQQFDPSLGQLVSVEIQHAGSITSEIRVENLSNVSGSHITGNVSGTLNLVAPGVNDLLNVNGSAGAFDALKWDNVNDFGGTSGTTFGQKTASGSNTIMVTDPATLQAYIGTGTVNVSENGAATSNAAGGGNLEVNVQSTGQATITVTYHYKSAGPLLPGTYKVVQPVEPAGYTDGLESQGSVVIPGTIGTDFINVSLPNTGGTSLHNDFGELKVASLSGHVYYDANNNGVFDPTESGIQGVTMTLTGPSGPQTATTDASGFYQFINLLPGTYIVAETQPAGYINGTDTFGTKGGVVHNVVNDENINSINLVSGDSGLNYDFGEVKRATLSGHVWYDANNDSVRDAAEAPISGATVQLLNSTGAVVGTTTTDGNGFYQFINLDPGAYSVREPQPGGYMDGKDNPGTTGGTAVEQGSVIGVTAAGTNILSTADLMQNVPLAVNGNSQNNDFGEIKPASLAGHVYFDANDDGIFEPNEAPIPGATVTLTGFDDQGPVNKSMPTNALGEYKFDSLRPGTYAVIETQPAGWADGKDTMGTPGSTQPGALTTNDNFSNILLSAGVDGVNNDFGEVKPDLPRPTPKSQGLVGSLPFISKTQMTLLGDTSNITPAMLNGMAFVVGADVTLLGQQPSRAQVFSGLAQLNAGMSTTTFVQQVWNTQEHRVNQANEIYQDILHRAPTSAELGQAVVQLSAGMPVVTLQEQLYSSADYQQLHGSQTALATALYQDILNITPGSAATQSLVQSMGNQTLQQVVHSLLTSAAGVANQIDDVYRATVRRPATAAEISLWTPQIQAGTLTLDSLAQRLLASQEFFLLAVNTIH